MPDNAFLIDESPKFEFQISKFENELRTNQNNQTCKFKF